MSVGAVLRLKLFDEYLWARDLTIAGSAKRKHEGGIDNALVKLGDGIMQFSYHSKMDLSVVFFFIFFHFFYFNTFKYLPSSLSFQN